MAFRLLHEDSWYVAIDKPSGFQTHQPEDPEHRVARSFDCVRVLRDQVGRLVYPVHRLDRATAGVLLFALDPESARMACAEFEQRRVEKTYYCVARGWVDESGEIPEPLDGKEARTRFERVATLELPSSVGRYSTARYSLVRAWPRTGRMHQIRRHFARVSHPLIGDSIYGDGKHNRFFKESLGIRSLLLKAHTLEVRHPRTREPLRIASRWKSPWHQIFELFGVCPAGAFPGWKCDKIL